MILRDQKEEVQNRIFYHHLPYTVIDVGFWHQISFPSVPSGRADYAFLGAANYVFGDGVSPSFPPPERQTFANHCFSLERSHPSNR